MNTPTPEQMQKLPKWAQEYIHLIELRYAEMKSEVSDYLDTLSESQVYTRRGLGAPRYLQTDSVTFVLPDGKVDVTLSGDRIECCAQYGSADFFIKPHSSNVVSLEIRKR
jgi:hypothetical protein